jgi:hypothetical protein
MRSITDSLTIHQRGNPTQNVDSVDDDDDSDEYSKPKINKGKVSLMNLMLLSDLPFAQLLPASEFQRVLDSEDEPTITRKRTNPSNDLDDADDDSKQEKKKAKTGRMRVGRGINGSKRVR